MDKGQSQCGFLVQHNKIIKNVKIMIKHPKLAIKYRQPHIPFRLKCKLLSMNKINILVFFYNSVFALHVIKYFHFSLKGNNYQLKKDYVSSVFSSQCLNSVGRASETKIFKGGTYLSRPAESYAGIGHMRNIFTKRNVFTQD